MNALELLVHPTAFMPPEKLLDGLSPAQAATHVTGTSHSVAEIVAHLDFWQSWFLARCAGEATPPAATASAGWRATAESEWEAVRQRFLDGLARAVEFASDESSAVRRVEPAIEFPSLAEYTIHDAMTHVAIHNAHHLGQVVTLRQLLGAWPPPGGSYTW